MIDMITNLEWIQRTKPQTPDPPPPPQLLNYSMEANTNNELLEQKLGLSGIFVAQDSAVVKHKLFSCMEAF